MLDIFALAFWSDTTRIGTFMFGDAQTQQDYSFLPGVKGAWHSISHHAENAERKEQYSKIINWNVEQLAYFLNKVKSLDEGGKSLLDNSMIMFGGSIKDGNQHTVENLPLLLAGRGKGTLRPGRRLRAPAKTPLCNLYVSLLERMGVAAKVVRRQHGAAARAFPRAMRKSSTFLLAAIAGRYRMRGHRPGAGVQPGGAAGAGAELLRLPQSAPARIRPTS